MSKNNSDWWSNNNYYADLLQILHPKHEVELKGSVARERKTVIPVTKTGFVN